MAHGVSLADLKQWDIWEVVWTHDDEANTSKQRPAIVLSTQKQIAAQGFARCIKITGEDHPEVPRRVCINPLDADFKYTGLTERSWVHPLESREIRDAELLYRRGHITGFTVAYLAMNLKMYDR